MDIKQVAIDTAKSAKFEGVNIDVDVINSRLAVNVHLKGSLDLPGDADQMVANVLHLLGLGKPSSSLQAG